MYPKFCSTEDFVHLWISAPLDFTLIKKQFKKKSSFSIRVRKLHSREHRGVNRCCSQNPCLNGGVCQEICDNHSPRFNCTCSYKYTGKRCGQITHPRSCTANNGASQSGKYDVFDSANKPFSVYYDLQSEPGFVWALIQSLSFANEATYKDKGFGTDFPVNDNSNEPDWNCYRFSLSLMQSLSNHFTHLRVTCTRCSGRSLHIR